MAESTNWLKQGIARSLAAAVTALVVVGALGLPSPLAASGPMQNGPEAPEITEPECSFWFDYDDDGEGDEPLSGNYVLQETPIVGGCDFKLSAPEEATIVVESELKDWEAEVELKREPSPAEDFKMYSARTEIPGVQGSMRVTANFVRGNTPRSARYRTLPDGYRHEVQIPEEFRLLEITVTTPDGRKDRLEQNAQSASGAYISAHRSISDPETELQEWAVTLAEEWLEEGYPQFVDSVITLDVASADAGSGGANWWKWGAIGTWGIIVVAVIIAAAILIFVKRASPPPQRRSNFSGL